MANPVTKIYYKYNWCIKYLTVLLVLTWFAAVVWATPVYCACKTTATTIPESLLLALMNGVVTRENGQVFFKQIASVCVCLLTTSDIVIDF